MENAPMIRFLVRSWTWAAVVFGTAFATAGGRQPAAAQSPPVRVALSGTPAPAGGNFAHPSPTSSAGGFAIPVVNDSGRVYFSSTLTGGPSTAGLFAGTLGAVQAVALQATPAPAGGNFTDSFSDLVQNNAGQIA